MPALRRQAAAATEVITGPGVPYDVFLGIIWAGAALSSLFMILRLTSRWRGPKRLFWDDAFAGLAATLVLVTAALWQWAARDIYYFLNLVAGLAPFEADFAVRLHRGLRASLIVELFFYTSLFLVKLSFLFFFRRLGTHVRGQQYIWWPVFAFSAISYIVSIGNVEYHCLVNTTAYITEFCSSQEAIAFTTATLIANCVLDVLSDFAIMAIPFTLLWNVRIHMRKKIAFSGIFSLTLITIAVAIARTADLHATAKASGQQDSTYLWMWSATQSSLAVVVSCLSAFPQLFTASSRAVKPQWTPTDTYYQRLKSRVKARSARSLDPFYDISAVSMGGPDMETVSRESQHPVLRPDINQPVAQCSVGPPSPNTPQQNQIMRKLEYQVAEHPNASWELPQGHHVSYGAQLQPPALTYHGQGQPGQGY